MRERGSHGRCGIRSARGSSATGPERADELEFNLLIQYVATSDDPKAEVEAWAAPVPGPKPDTERLFRAPQLLAGTADEIAASLHERREHYGFSYVAVFEPALETFASVPRALAGE